MGHLRVGSNSVKAERPDQLNLFGPCRPSSIINVGRSYRYCTGESWLTGPGKGPHVAALTCVSCGKHGGWLSRSEARALTARIAP